MVSAIILAGGMSVRMGRDKKFLEIDGKSFIERAVDVAREFADEIIIVVGSRAQMERTEALGLEGVTVVVDILGGMGPVMGLLTGMYAAEGEWVVALPSDAPMMDAEIFRYMIDRVEGYDAVVPVNGEYLEPLHAVYERGIMMEACAWALEIEGMRASLHKVIRGFSKVNYIPVEGFRKYDRDLLTFHSVNTEEDLDEILKMVK